MTEIYLESLDVKRRQTFAKLKVLAKLGVLAGGSALALQIKHRYSFDFDIFFDKPIVEESFRKIKRIFHPKTFRINLPHHKTFATKDDIQITLFHYEFKPLYPKVKTHSLPLFNKKDISADKAYTLGRRPVWRDYVDLFFLLKDKHANLKQIIKDARKKFNTLFEPKLFLEQLTFYEDINNFKIKFIKENYPPLQIQEFLKKEVLDYLKEEL